MTSRELARELRGAGIGEVDDSSLARAMYASDASLYRVPPEVVVRPRDTDELLAALAVARDTGTPVTMRGAGTSIAGNAVGAGLVVDTSRHLDRVLEIDPDARTARVQPGVVQAALQRTVAPYGLRFGPDPSSYTRCTIGGMLGNNACGARALGYGRTSENVLGLEVALASGDRLSLGPGRSDAAVPGLGGLVDDHLALVRTEFGRFPRQGSGYALEHLLPERGRRLDRFMVGSEGTLGVVLSATVRLVPDPPRRVLAVLGYPGMAEAADAVPALADHPLVACEGLDARLVRVVLAAGRPVPDLPRGGGWLLAEVTGGSVAEAEAAARAVVREAAAVDSRVVTDADECAALWQIREDGAGLAARSMAGPGHSGWEDAAVPPDRLGDYLRDFDALLRTHGLDGVPYGHFGDGCVHVRIDFALADAEGRHRFRVFLEQAAGLVASYGGTLSGEHGDGRARSALLPAMYSAEALELMARVKHLFDPHGLLNPGVLVAPRPPEADLRAAVSARDPGRGLRWAQDDGSVVRAVHRCIGIGKCVAPATGAVMCPSFRATREEKDSTRGRARVLQEMVGGSLVTDGWSSPEVHDALDLCLACKGCARDCPTGVDMATYKAEALHQRYRRRVRPRSHYTLGWLPRWLRVGGAVSRRALGARAVQEVAKLVAGVDRRRSIPRPAPKTARQWARQRRRPDGRPDVVLWADTFTDHFAPQVLRAACTVLERAGLSVDVVDRGACCGLTWLSTGQLSAARRQLRRTLAVLHEYAEQEIPVVGLEPSCLASLRSDALELLDDPRVAAVAGNTRTLAELLDELPGWEPPDLGDLRVVAQPHCHHASVLGWDADARLLERAGAAVTRVPGCCGLAGDWGVRRGHHEVSVMVAELDLLPAVRRAGPGAVVLADGFSCRTQLADLAGVGSLHLAQLLEKEPAPG